MGKSKQSVTMILTYKTLVCFATILASIEASAPRLRPDLECAIFSKYRDPNDRPCRPGCQILNNMANWTELAETEMIDNRLRLVIPYVIKPKFSDKPASFWKKKSPGGAKPANAEEWIAKVRPEIKKAVDFYESTNVFFREYSESDVVSGRLAGKHYIVISDFYDLGSSGCTADLGPFPAIDHVEIDIERCRNDKVVGSQYHPGMIAHEFMHILGFLHEHQRQDRDRYLKVRLPPHGALDYQKDERGRILTPYDPESITHYGLDKYIRINSDHPKSTDMTLIGQLEKLSKLDIEQINLNYPVEGPTTEPLGSCAPKEPRDTGIDQISYHYIDRPLDWHSANTFCQQNFEKGSLATVHNQREVNKFEEVVPNFKEQGTDSTIWLGAGRASDDNDRLFWLWADEPTPTTAGSELCYDDPRYNTNRPSSGAEKCLESAFSTLEGGMTFNDIWCSLLKTFVCSSRGATPCQGSCNNGVTSVTHQGTEVQCQQQVCVKCNVGYELKNGSCQPLSARRVILSNPRFSDGTWYNYGFHNLKPEYAIDGRKITYTHSDRSSHSDSHDFLVDIEKSCEVTDVIVYPRPDCDECFDRYATMSVYVYHEDNNDYYQECKPTDVFDSNYVGNHVDTGLKFLCPNVPGTLIKITTNSASNPSLRIFNQIAEIEAFCN